ncbi:MAG: hypothetical protein H7Z21_08950, partial [Hymenobacter sp.]|nr:hypothetical protein [Hymenobacter sp.]
MLSFANRVRAQAPIPGLPFWEWQQPSTGGFGFHGLHQLNDSVLVAVGSHGTAMKTTNGGRTWQSLLTGATREVYSVSFTTAQVGWLGSETEATTPLHYRAGPGWLRRTADGGQTWQPQDIGEPTLSVTEPRVTAVSATEAYVSYRLTGTSGPPNYSNLPFEPRLRHTVDGGLSWTAPALPAFNSNYVYSAVVCPIATTAFFTAVGPGRGSYSQLLRSTDRGLTWQAHMGSFGSTFSANQVVFSDALHGWVLGLDEATATYLLYASTDGGQTWALRATLAALYPGGLTFADALHGLFSANGTYYATADGGLTWNPTTGGMPGALYFNRTTQLGPGGTGWAVSANAATVYRTLDYGQTFELRASLPPANAYRALAFPDPTHGWALPNFYWGDLGTSVLRTSKRGQPWQVRTLDGLLPNVAPYNTRVGAGAFPDADTAWVGGYTSADNLGSLVGLVARTTDGGRTWSRQTLGASPSFGEVEAMGCWDTRRAVALESNQYLLFSTRDGGRTWTGAPNPDPARRTREVV